MRACMDENGMKFDEGEVDELTRALFHDAVQFSLTPKASPLLQRSPRGRDPGVGGVAAAVGPAVRKISAAALGKFDSNNLLEILTTLAPEANFVFPFPPGGSLPLPAGSFDPLHNNNGISFEALKAQLTKHDGLLQNLSISIDRWLVPPKPKKPETFYQALISKVFSSI